MRHAQCKKKIISVNQIKYKNNATQTINKDNKLFSDILKQMNKRVKGEPSTAKLAFDKDSMNTTKQTEIVVEFLYSKSQKSKFGPMVEKE